MLFAGSALHVLHFYKQLSKLQGADYSKMSPSYILLLCALIVVVASEGPSGPPPSKKGEHVVDQTAFCGFFFCKNE